MKACLGALVLDWQAALEAGSIAARPDLQRLALERAVEADDTALLERLEASGVELGQLIRGGVNGPVFARLLKRDAAQAWFAVRGIAERQREDAQ